MPGPGVLPPPTDSRHDPLRSRHRRHNRPRRTRQSRRRAGRVADRVRLLCEAGQAAADLGRGRGDEAPALRLPRRQHLRRHRGHGGHEAEVRPARQAVGLRQAEGDVPGPRDVGRPRLRGQRRRSRVPEEEGVAAGVPRLLRGPEGRPAAVPRGRLLVHGVRPAGQTGAVDPARRPVLPQPAEDRVQAGRTRRGVPRQVRPEHRQGRHRARRGAVEVARRATPGARGVAPHRFGRAGGARRARLRDVGQLPAGAQAPVQADQGHRGQRRRVPDRRPAPRGDLETAGRSQGRGRLPFVRRVFQQPEHAERELHQDQSAVRQRDPLVPGRAHLLRRQLRHRAHRLGRDRPGRAASSSRGVGRGGAATAPHPRPTPRHGPPTPGSDKRHWPGKPARH